MGVKVIIPAGFKGCVRSDGVTTLPDGTAGPRLLTTATHVRFGKLAATKPGLGDRLEKLLTACGITQERYRAIKVELGFSDTCGCPARKEFLNRWPRVLVLGFARGGLVGAFESSIKLAREIRAKYQQEKDHG